MGSLHPLQARCAAAGTSAAAHPQGRLSVLLFDDFFDVDVDMVLIAIHAVLYLPKFERSLRLHSLVARAAFGIEELKQPLKRVSVGGVAKKRALSLHTNQIFRFELVEMMRQSGAGISTPPEFRRRPSPRGWAESRSRMIRRRGSVPMAENMSAYLATCSADFLV